MGNRTRINLDNSKILQLTGDTLSLSGTTYFGNAEYIPNPNRVLFENSFVSKKYLEEAVSGLTGTEITGATNGLTVEDNVVKLGGTLDGETTIETAFNKFEISSSGFGALVLNGNDVDIGSTSNPNFSVISGDFRIRSESGAVIESFGGDLAITTNNSNTGMAYTGTYIPASPDYIPPAGWVTGITSTIEGNLITLTGRVDDLETWSGVTDGRLNTIETTFITGATNGLTKVGQDVVLGGTLVENTNLNLDENSLIYSNILKGFDAGTGFNTTVRSIIEDINGKYVIGGDFTTYTGATHNRIIRLNKDGSVDNTFNTGIGFSASVYSIIEDDDKYLIGGNFTGYTGTTHNRIIRLNKDGSIDTTFVKGIGFNNYVSHSSIIEDSDGKYVIGGEFTQYQGATHNRIIRLNKDGSIDTTFVKGTGFLGTVLSIIEDSDGKYVIGGNFTTYTGASHNRIIRLNKDGSVDNTFNKGSGFNDTIESIIEDIDGKYVIGGEFTQYSGLTGQGRIIRLNKDGSVDNTFVKGTGLDGGPAPLVLSITEDSDGKYLIGGFFTTYSGLTGHNNIIRLNKDGNVDNTFNTGTGFNGFGVFSIIEDKDIYGKYVIGGWFTTYKGLTGHNYIIRLNNDGSVDNIDENFDFLLYSGNTVNYISNVSSNYTNRSLVDKEYVDISIEQAVSGITGGSGGGISGATNGLTIDNNIVKLGGTLVENTEIIGQSYNLGITANTINFDANIILDGIVETGNTITDNILSKNKTNNKVKIIDTVELTSDIIDDLLKISIVFTSGNTSLNGAYNNKLIIHTTTGNTLTLASGLTDGTKFNIKYYNQDETLIIDGDGIDIDFLSTLTLSGNTTYTEIVYSETLNKFLALK